ncbi:MAG: hypothetical protein PUE84_04240 [Firmicutes bacterium]|nr:hypothetical protein [Bacillota bacterium]
MKEFNYQEQLLLWKKNQLLLQKKYADTPPGFPSAEAENAAWENWKEEYTCFLEHRHFKINDTALPSASFPLIGREEELTAVHDMLASFHTVFLQGIGGIGKTAIALAYIARHRLAYDHVLYIVTDRGILQAVCDDTSVPISGLLYDRKRYPVLRQYYREKLRALQKISEKKKILIVIDNMNMPADKDLRQFLELSCDKIITTRVNYEIVPEKEKLLVNALPPEYWPKLIETCSGGLKPAKTEQLLQYGYQVEGHTLSIKMASVQASNGELSEPPDNGSHITSLLSSFRLKKAEWETLLYLSVLAPQGMEKDLFLRISGASEHTLRSLRNYLLVDVLVLGKTTEHSPEDPDRETEARLLLRVHPLIAEAVRRIMPPTCINCSRLLRGFEKYMYGDDIGICTWNRTYEENLVLEPHVFAVCETFPDPAPWLATAFEEIVTFLWVQGYYEKALPYALKVYEAVMNYYGPNHVLPGREALRVAAVYHNHMDHDQALMWYQKGYELLKAVTPRTFEVMDQLSSACAKLAKEYSHRQDPVARNKYTAEYLQIAEAIMQMDDKDLSAFQKQRFSMKQNYVLLEEAKLALREGRIAVSRELYATIEKWIKSREDLGYRKTAFKELQIALLIHENQLEGAEKTARENVQSALLYRGEKYKDYLSQLEILADVLALEKKSTEAFSIYEKILIHLQRDYPYEENWIRKIMDRLTVNE